MRISRPIFLSLLCWALLSCGRYDRLEDGGFTRVVFGGSSGSGVPGAGIMAGGVMVYAYSPSYSAAKKLDSEGPTTMDLPNGVYSFYAFGYTQAFSPQNDDQSVRCAILKNVGLSGSSLQVSLSLTQANCNAGEFTGNGAFTSPSPNTSATNSPMFPKISPIFCGSAAGTALLNLAGTNTCGFAGSGVGISQPWTSVSRYKVSFPAFIRAGGNFQKSGASLDSACTGSFPSASGNAPATEFSRVPLGSLSLGAEFPLEISVYSETSCTSTPLAVHRFERGLIFGPNPDPSHLGKVVFNSSTNTTRIFLREP